MRSVAAASLLAASLASQVAATIYVTQPVSSTVCTAGQTCTVAWNDDGNAPVLATIGPCSIDLCTGGQVQQTCLQNISPSLDVSTNAQVTFLPTAADGPNGPDYFIRFSSLAYMDPTNPAYHYESYSAKFTLAGMTGVFNATVQGELTMVAGAATTAAVAASVTNATPTFLATSTAKPLVVTSAVKSTAAATSTAKKSGAVAITVPGVVSSVAGVTVVMSFASVFLGMLAFGL